MVTSKREKIILGLAILAVLYLGGNYLFSHSDGGAGFKTKDNSTIEFVMDIAQQVARNNLTDAEQRILEEARKPWPDQPFIKMEVSLGETRLSDSSTAPSAESDAYSFTGYLEIGSKHLAIINGEEYETGDRLTESKAIVRGISPEQVLLVDAEGRIFKVPRADLRDGDTTPALQYIK